MKSFTSTSVARISERLQRTTTPSSRTTGSSGRGPGFSRTGTSYQSAPAFLSALLRSLAAAGV